MSASHRGLSWSLLLPPLVVPTVGALFYFVIVPEGALGKSVYTATKLFTLLYPVFFLRQIGLGGIIRRRREDSTVEWPGWRSVVVIGLVTGVAIAAVGFLLMLTPMGEMVREGAGRVAARAEGLGFKEHFLLFAIFVSVIHSGLEEYYWRWFLYGQLRHKMTRRDSEEVLKSYFSPEALNWELGWKERPAAHLIAAVAFGGHHLIITLQFFPAALAFFLTACVVVGGLIWSIMYERQGTVVGCWVSHLCVDVMLMIIGFELIMGA